MSNPVKFILMTVIFCLPLAGLTMAAINVDGIVDKMVYAGSVEFTVDSEAGYTYDVVTLNDDPIAVDTLIKVDSANYYEIYVHRINDSTSAEESVTVRFIIRDLERKSSEVGLPPFTPYPPINSAAAEYVGATLNIVTPANYPMGLEIPVAARVNVVDDPNERVGVIGNVTAAGFEGYPLKLLRGAGHVFLPAQTVPGTVNYNAVVHSLSVPKTINIEASTTWQTESGTINSDTNWGTNARIHINGQLIVAAGAELTIGAGSVIKIDPDLEIKVLGSIDVNGTNANPVTFTTDDRNAPWGGILFPTAASTGEFDGTIMTASGAAGSWSYPGHSVKKHKGNQPLLYLYGGANVTLTDCYLIDHHGVTGSSQDSTLTMTRCLVQQFVTCGQYNNGSVSFNDCALLEFPAWDAPFVDLDNDGLYMTGGDHFFTNTIIGWALDDGLDAGSGAGGNVTLKGCWLESSYHEAMAWSNSNGEIPPRVVAVADTVTINCGQGIECGFGEPEVTAVRCFSTGNVVGARFGDNYGWNYNGFLDVTDSLLLYNLRDVWGFDRKYWNIATDKMNIEDNYLSIPNSNFPTNTLWDPITTPSQADLLIPFLPTPATTVGIGLGTYQDTVDTPDLPGNGIPGSGIGVCLSTFTTNIVYINYAIIDPNGDPYGSGTLQFAPGQTVRKIPFAPPARKLPKVFGVSISDPVNADITGFQQITVTVPAIPYEIEKDLILVGDDWLYRKGTSEPPSDWNDRTFTPVLYPTGDWYQGATPIGYETSSGYETCIATDIIDMKYNYWSVYARKTFTITEEDRNHLFALIFRIDFDDGYIAYLNGKEVHSQKLDSPAAYNKNAKDHEAVCGSNIPYYDISEFIPDLVIETNGTNVLAIQVHNQRLNSSDFIIIPELSILLSPYPGDSEPDGDMDLLDFTALALSWLTSSEDDAYDPYCDINAPRDGIIDMLDLALFAQNWGEDLEN